MTDNHIQNVVQYMMAEGCVEEDTLREKLKEIANLNGESDVDDDRVSQMINQANKNLKRFNMMIRGSMDEVTTKRYYVLISTVDNDITHSAVQYTPKQYEFFKHILQSIVYEPRGIISESTIKNLAERNSVADYRNLFRTWCLKNWFVRVEENGEDFITLGVRSTAELDVFIKNKLIERPDELNCKSCGTMAIYSKSCSNCSSRFHKKCSKLSIDIETDSCKLCSKGNTIEPRPSTSSARSGARKTTPKAGDVSSQKSTSSVHRTRQTARRSATAIKSEKLARV